MPTDDQLNAQPMSPQQTRAVVIDAVISVIESSENIDDAASATAEVGSIDPDTDLFEELDLDSLDHLGLMTLLWEHTGVDIPEREYARLRTIGTITDHLVTAGARSR